MNYKIDVEKFINFMVMAKGQPHALPTDVLAKVQLSPTQRQDPDINFDLYEEPVLRKMFNGLVFMALYESYVFHKDNGARRVEEWCECLRDQIQRGGLPTAYGVITFAIHKHQEFAEQHAVSWYGHLMMPQS